MPVGTRALGTPGTYRIAVILGVSSVVWSLRGSHGVCASGELGEGGQSSSKVFRDVKC